MSKPRNVTVHYTLVRNLSVVIRVKANENAQDVAKQVVEGTGISHGSSRINGITRHVADDEYRLVAILSDEPIDG